ncbi:PadR family transcriptional regulator [Spongisporangium articulatum]|uniref:PadR family transcriptional regulator n=1 Tax=Spongisporangium articulatum TaxID=3362603 RepID=A0ABW8AHE9_9ACTN
MSIRQSLLTLLVEGDRHGYQLRQDFEARTAGTWPVNIGQVYTTLNRLVRDGLAVEVGKRDDGSVVYRVTDAGRDEVTRWWRTPVDRSTPARDEMAIKLALALTAPGVDVAAVIQVQRSEVLTALQAWTREKAALADPPRDGELARLLVLDNLIFSAEAEIRWLDHCEQRLATTTTGAPRR